LLSPTNVDVPLQLLPVVFEQSQQLWLFGRDLSGVSQMQRRLVEAHQSMERDYLRLRHMEARYRLLFDSVAEPMLVVDVAQRRVIEANHAAQQVFKDILKRLPGSDVTQCFESSSGDALDALLRSAQTSGRTESTRLRILKADQDCGVVAGASVVAKVWRDDLMVSLSQQHPEFGWDGNKGYGAAVHMAAIATHGATDWHRRTWLHGEPDVAPGAHVVGPHRQRDG
jgi:ribonuclease HII